MNPTKRRTVVTRDGRGIAVRWRHFCPTPVVRQSGSGWSGRGGRLASRSPAGDAAPEFLKDNVQERLVAAAKTADAVFWRSGDGAAAVDGPAIAMTGEES